MKIEYILPDYKDHVYLTVPYSDFLLRNKQTITNRLEQKKTKEKGLNFKFFLRSCAGLIIAYREVLFTKLQDSPDADV